MYIVLSLYCMFLATACSFPWSSFFFLKLYLTYQKKKKKACRLGKTVVVWCWKQYKEIGATTIGTCQEMKFKLWEKIMLSSWFDELKARVWFFFIFFYFIILFFYKDQGKVVEEPCQTLIWFKIGLRADILRDMLRQSVDSVENAFKWLLT